MKNNIALIGFMGAGKTVTGQALARLLHMDFVDTDDIIEQEAGTSIADIFASKGEEAFRRIETAAVRQACGRQYSVIACGGGVVLRPENTALLKEAALVIYLETQPDAILKRVGSSGAARPLLNVDNPASTIAAMLAARGPLYKKAADLIIDTTDLAAEAVVRQIKSELGRYEGFNLQKQNSR